ncbi:MAG: Ig-like domain-containing protein [Pseudomonadota bacterium]
MKSLKLLILGTSLSIVGCGGGGGGTGTMTPFRDTTPPRVQSSNPTNGASPVSINVDPELIVSEALSVATVNDTTVVFRDAFGKRIRGDVSYDSARNAIVFEPRSALEFRRGYELSVNGATDVAGNAFSTTLTFTTFANPVTQSTTFSGGNIARRTDSQNDVQGRTTRTDIYEDAGADMTWFTADDGLRQYLRATFNADGLLALSELVNGIGPDQQWFTNDDTTVGYSILDYDAIGNNSRQVSGLAGADGIVGTVDDSVFQYVDFGYNEYGNVLSIFVANGPGPDQVWLTGDDNADLTIRTVDETGRVASDTRYDTPGPDNIWFTEDDRVSQHRVWTSNADRTESTSITYNAPGQDQRWFTDDDTVSAHSVTTFDAQTGRSTSEYSFNGPGPDAVWFTDDDDLSAHARITYDDTVPGLTTRTFVLYADAGPDGQRYTFDDPISFYSDTTSTEKSTTTRLATYADPGPDGVFLTDDDVPNPGYLEIFYDHNGTRTHRLDYAGPGPDGIAFTADDSVQVEALFDASR